MALTTSTITGRVPLPTDIAPVWAEVVFTLVGFDTEGAELLPSGATARFALTSNGEMPAVAQLWKNVAGIRGTAYVMEAHWKTRDREGDHVYSYEFGLVQVGAAASYTVAELINAAPVPPPIGTFWSSITEPQYDAIITAAVSAAASAATAVAQAALLAGVQAYGALGNGSRDDTADFVTALGATTGPVYVPLTASHYVLSILSDANRSRLWGPGKLLVGGTMTEISRVPRVGDDRPTLSIVDRDWNPGADFATVDVAEGPFLMDVWRKGTGVGSFGWGTFIGVMPDEKPAGVHDHIVSIWAIPARVTGPSTRTNGLWVGAASTASNIAGQGGTTGIDGIFTAAEFNFSNQKYDAGIRTTFGGAGDIAGLLLVPDTIPSPLGVNYWTVSNITIASPGVLTVTGHNFVNNMGFRIYANGGTLPTGLVDGQVYWIVNVSGSTFQLSATPGGAAINTTGSFGAGVRGVPSYHAPHALVFAPSVNNQQIGVPIECETNTIQDGGHFINAKGSSVTTPRPSNVLLVSGTWTRAIDTTGATFTSGIFAIHADNQATRWGSAAGAGIRGTTGTLDLTPGGTANGRLLSNGFAGAVGMQWNTVGVAFNGTAPIAKPTLPAAATDLATVIALANAMRLNGFINYGLAA